MSNPDDVFGRWRITLHCADGRQLRLAWTPLCERVVLGSKIHASGCLTQHPLAFEASVELENPGATERHRWRPMRKRIALDDRPHLGKCSSCGKQRTICNGSYTGPDEAPVYGPDAVCLRCRAGVRRA